MAVLGFAVESGYTPANPATRRPVRLDAAEQIEALLDAASPLDARATTQARDKDNLRVRVPQPLARKFTLRVYAHASPASATA